MGLSKWKLKDDFIYEAEVLNIVDGDTIDVLIDLGFDTYQKHRVRLAGIDAYETSLRGDTTEEQKHKGIEGKQFLIKHILGEHVKIYSHKEKGKFGRYIVFVYAPEALFRRRRRVTASEEETPRYIIVNELMVEKGFAIDKQY
jgi:micrococcal nuclease